jgi:hypothetical protein
MILCLHNVYIPSFSTITRAQNLFDVIQYLTIPNPFFTNDIRWLLLFSIIYNFHGDAFVKVE